MNKLQKLIYEYKFNEAYDLVKTLDNKDPLLTPKESYDPFLSSCYHNQNNLISALLDKGVDINSIDNSSGVTALHMLIRSNGDDKHIETALFLLEKGANPDICDKNKKYPLTEAILNQNYILAEAIIEKSSNLNYVDGSGYTAIRAACFRDAQRVIDKLIENGMNLNLQDNKGKTPIFYAKNRPTIEKFIYNGTNIGIKDHKGKTVLDYEMKSSFKYNSIKRTLQKKNIKEEKKEKELVTKAIKTIKRKRKTQKKLGFRN